MRLSFLFLVLSSMLLIAGGSRELLSAGTCKCTCCRGNDCTPTYIGTVEVSRASECVLLACVTEYPTDCPNTSAEEPGSVIADYDSAAMDGKSLPSTLLLTAILALPVLYSSTTLF
mmetsp:Transcript_692/g.4468  ORF Transcript_692/g.4468 Transcript_692/m.4468 type:complete len:116 (-) Transcript_692:111-458(-)